MGQTIAEKIFSGHAKRKVGVGEILFVPVDVMMSNDASFPWFWRPSEKYRLIK